MALIRIALNVQNKILMQNTRYAYIYNPGDKDNLKIIFFLFLFLFVPKTLMEEVYVYAAYDFMQKHKKVSLY